MPTSLHPVPGCQVYLVSVKIRRRHFTDLHDVVKVWLAHSNALAVVQFKFGQRGRPAQGYDVMSAIDRLY